MGVKKLLLVMLACIGVFLQGCSCETWTSFWGGDTQEECLDHWTWKPKEPVKEPEPVKSPCAAPETARTVQSYPMGEVFGNVVRLEKMAPKEIRSGEAFDYRIKVTNLTDRALRNVLVTEQIPENMRIESSMPEVGKVEAGKVHWMLGELEAETSRMISITAIAEGEDTVTSCAEVFYESPICAKMNIVEPQLELTKYAPDESLVCDRIPVRYVVTNTGSGFACDIAIEDELAEGLLGSEGQSRLEFAIAELAPGQSQEFNAMLDVSKTGQYASKGTATSRIGGKVESNMPTTFVREPVLSINETCPSKQFIGRMLTYEITVSNRGDGIARDAIVEATVPENVRFNSATEGGKFSHASPGKVVWKLGSIEPDSSKKVSMTLSAEAAGTVNTEAMAKAYCAATVTDTCQTELSGIPAVLLEVIDIADPIEIGEDETYIITVTNQGSAAATNVQVNCVLEATMDYVSSIGPTEVSLVDRKITFAPLSSLAPKAQAKWQVKIRAIGAGDNRFKVMMSTDQLDRMVEETEATRFYE